jgi:hypothetical protein
LRRSQKGFFNYDRLRENAGLFCEKVAHRLAGVGEAGLGLGGSPKDGGHKRERERVEGRGRLGISGKD